MTGSDIDNAGGVDERKQGILQTEIDRILDECRLSHGLHTRKLKELSAFRASSSPPSLDFFLAFSRSLSPLFGFPRRSASAERAARFAAAFAVQRDARDPAVCDAFLHRFLRLLILGSKAADRSARFWACMIISEIILQLPEDIEVIDELWDEVIDHMKERVKDKVPAIRAFAIRSLSRFANGEENDDIVQIFLQSLPQETNTEVRKTILFSLPPSNVTCSAVVDSTLDISEFVRRAAYIVLAKSFPLQSLSIKHRTLVLQRGLTDRSPNVPKECLRMLKDEWLAKCCNGDPVTLLRYLDVETYESVGEIVMETLLKDGMVHTSEQSMRQYFKSQDHVDECESYGVQLMEAEYSLYWKALCGHLQTAAQAKGSDAATASGAEAAIYASEASETNDLLDGILPESVSDYTRLVKAHLVAGRNYRFASRQLLQLGSLLDFSDSTNRKDASAFVQELLLRSLEFEFDDDGSKVVIGDGISLGGDQYWAKAVAELVKKVHASAGEFEEVVLQCVEVLALPCRERTADFIQWMHCLALAGLMLENLNSLRSLNGKVIGPSELLNSLLLPGAKHSHVDVQRVAIRCLCLFGLLEKTPSKDIVKQLWLSFTNGPSSVSVMASKALVDLGTWHDPQEIDRADEVDEQISVNEKDTSTPVDLLNLDDNKGTRLLDLLSSGLERVDLYASNAFDGHESVQSILAEGLAKFLLLSENYPSISSSLCPSILSKLMKMYFSEETKKQLRLRQCLSVFFEHYPAISSNHKKIVSKAFILIIRSMWPGINGNPGGAPVFVSRMRKQAVHAARFLLRMLQTPLFAQEDENQSKENPENTFKAPDFEPGEEGLGLRIASEVINCPEKKTPAGKSYVSALCRVVVLLNFRPTEKEPIKCMRGLLTSMMASVCTDKDVVAELNVMGGRLRSLDESPEEELPQEKANAIFAKLEIDGIIELNNSYLPPPTPAPRSIRTATRRRAKRESSTEALPPPPALVTPNIVGTRSQRASKVAALSKISSKTPVALADSEDEEVDSGMTSQSTSDESCEEFSE